MSVVHLLVGIAVVAKPQQPLNVLLITIDDLRPWLGVYVCMSTLHSGIYTPEYQRTTIYNHLECGGLKDSAAGALLLDTRGDASFRAKGR